MNGSISVIRFGEVICQTWPGNTIRGARMMCTHLDCAYLCNMGWIHLHAFQPGFRLHAFACMVVEVAILARSTEQNPPHRIQIFPLGENILATYIHTNTHGSDRICLLNVTFTSHMCKRSLVLLDYKLSICSCCVPTKGREVSYSDWRMTKMK